MGTWGVALLFLNYYFLISVTYVDSAGNVYIVYMGEKWHEDTKATTKYHHEMLSTLLGSKEAAKNSILYSYKHGFSGFAATLTKSQADEIAEFPGVIHVIPNRIHKLHTTRSWDFLGLNSQSPGNLLSDSNISEGTIIGVIDSGIWPESESFNDKNMGPIPSHWRGICQNGEQFNSTNCNKKLIGARWFVKGVKSDNKKPINTTGTREFLSPRDGMGHGTHTASTAAGRFVDKISYRGLAAGVARGGAPFARLAIYKACWVIGTEGCSDADLLQAFDKAIYDRVDILSVSIGIQIPLFPYVDQRDSISIGSFHAMAKGITVVCSAGNDGPFSQKIVNTAPWLITVAASTIDRAFPTAITLGNNHTLMGQSLDTRKHKGGFSGLVYSERIALDPKDATSLSCEIGSINASLAKGKIVLCFSIGDNHGIGEASYAVSKAGGIGVIFAQSRTNLLDPCDLIPCIKVDYEVGTQILSYIRKTRSPIAKLSRPKTIIGKWVSPRVAYFSSRGPSSISPTVLKPDVAAPGVSILAAYTPSRGAKKGDYAIESGTSMACPHVAGIAALIKSVHREWSPAAIKSALVTTASQTGTDRGNIIAEGATRKQADPFDMGGGQVNPNKAAHPGLVYNMSTQDYVQFLCSMGYSISAITNVSKSKTSCLKNGHSILDLNLPSISIPNLKRNVTISRTLTNVGPVNSVYKVMVQSPHGVKMEVEPQTLSFNSSFPLLSFGVTFSSTQMVHGDYSFGSLTWTDGEHFVRSPVAVRAIKYESYADM